METANDIARARAHYLALADKTRRADGTIPADVRDGLAWVRACERRWCIENPGQR